MRELPTGTVTFLFTDIEGSTKLLHELGAEGYSGALAEHRRILREAFNAHGGVEVDTQGDAFFVAFPTAPGALSAAADAQAALAGGPIRVRMGIHTGTPHLSAEGYVGHDVHRAARIGASGHGGQILVSKETRQLVPDELIAYRLIDLGEHRVKDFDAPVWIFQLGKERFPPLRTISNTNLPRPASSFVGREREVTEIGALLRDGARFLTLTGPGGTGKTRLSIEAAAELVPEFKAGVFWVGLAALRDPALVAETIAQTIGAKNGLAAHIGEREMLLLLDNLEQVVEAAPDLAALVEACPNLRLLTTSRELLRVRGELEYPVLPLADPEAVDLFCARAGLAPDATIAELCRRLDNLPLALELAASRVSVLSPTQILERLAKRLDLLKGGRDTDPRQKTLRATIEWSYDLLAAEEKTLFARLAVFRGGCTLEAAEEVAEADLDVLGSLVDKSLLRHTDDRFAMLETIREYAAERLEAAGAAEEFRRRHAEHFLALAEQAERDIRDGTLRDRLDRLERDHDNLRATLDWFEASGAGATAMTLAGAMANFWYLRGHVAEGKRRLEQTLHDKRPTAGRAKALTGLALMALDGGDPGTMKRCAQEALAIHQQLGDARGAAVSMQQLGHATLDLGDLAEGQRLFEESIGAFRELGSGYAALLSTHGLALVAHELGDLPRARALLEENLRQARASGLERVEARALSLLGFIASEEGRIEGALALLKAAYRIDRETGEALGIVLDLCRSARALVLQGAAENAALLLASAEAFRKEIGLIFRPFAVKMNDETLAAIRRGIDEAAFDEAWERGRGLTPDDAVELALSSGA